LLDNENVKAPFLSLAKRLTESRPRLLQPRTEVGVSDYDVEAAITTKAPQTHLLTSGPMDVRD
jgi:hypothetical protein